MPLQKTIFKPGINREGTAYDNEGGWFDCNLVRFRKGRPEKFGGWEKLTTNTYLGTARALHSWISLEGTKFLKITHEGESAFAFIDKKTGDVFKPRGWRKAAKGVRYNLLDKVSTEKLFNNLDTIGEHLYQYAVNFINKK